MLTLACLDLSRESTETLLSAHATAADRCDTARHWRPRRRRQSLAGRALLRHLATGIGIPQPAQWHIRPNSQLQPQLVSTDGQRCLAAALAHSHDRVAAALSDQGPVGIDLELIRPERDVAEMAALAFGPAERRLCAGGNAAAFHRLWTLREALAKACGIGFPMVVDGRDYFAEAPTSGPWTQEIDGTSWLFATRALPGGYAFALALAPPFDPPAVIAAALDAMRTA